MADGPVDGEAATDKTQALRGRGGLAPRYWSEAIELQGSRIEEDYRSLIEAPRESRARAQAFRHLHMDIHFLLIATGHVLDRLRACADVLDDETIDEIHDDFDTRAPYIKHVRDVLEHLDEYTGPPGLQDHSDLRIVSCTKSSASWNEPIIR